MSIKLSMNKYVFFFFQAEDGIRDAQESRGLGDVYKRQGKRCTACEAMVRRIGSRGLTGGGMDKETHCPFRYNLLDILIKLSSSRSSW